MWDIFTHHARESLLTFQDVTPDHPIWSDRPYKVFCYTPTDIEDRIDDICSNPAKENLPSQSFPFITPYNGWPHPKPK
jgi:hypothetical protein